MAAVSRGSLDQYFKETKKNKSEHKDIEPLQTTVDQIVAKNEGETEKIDVTIEHAAVAKKTVKKAKEIDQKSKTKKDEQSKERAKKRRKKKAESTEVQCIEKKIARKTIEIGDADRNLKQSSITTHFKIRRSGRRCKSSLKTEEHDKVMQKILDEDESGLEVKVLEEKGRGIFAAKDFQRGELICEYAGELIDCDLGLERERAYAENPEFGCYSYFFQYQNKKYCVDATKETTRLGRLLNHSKTNRNVCTKVFPIKDIPKLILVASRDIKTGEELVYDYGERSKVAIESHPWLKS